LNREEFLVSSVGMQSFSESAAIITKISTSR
jgi:hypothetical protein